MPTSPRRARALHGLCAALLTAALQAGAAEPFVDDARVGYHLRSFYMDKTNTDGSVNQAWAGGGWLYARSGWWHDTVQLGATYYFSLPLYAPPDEGGTQLLRSGQQPISALGELYARLRHAGQTLTLYRQEIQMGVAAPQGVRANRSDLSYAGKLDNRMVPVTYEAALLGGPIEVHAPQALRYWAGYLWNAKPRDQNGFVSIGQAIGAKDSDAGMALGGLQWSPTEDLRLQAWVNRSDQVLGIAFLDLDYVHRLSGQRYWRLAAQYTRQDSAGGSALTGRSFDTWNGQAYGEFGWSSLKLYGAYSSVADGEQIRTPFSSGPIYTQMVTRSFVRAGESTWLLGINVGLDALVPGLGVWIDYADGRGAIHADTGALLTDERELDLGVVWTFRDKGSLFDGARLRARAAWVEDVDSPGRQRGSDYRIDINWPISLL